MSHSVFTEPEITPELVKKHGLTDEEYQKILSILGRTPSFTELGIFSVMWSEHCSYKNSILEIKKLPRSGGRLLVDAGEENAGLVDIGDNLAVAFKIESHNHPSAVEPVQGAATGVGGIHRDIFTMGARPIASLNSLRFGNPDHPRTRFLLEGVVKGISMYGNSFGVPTVAGEVYFEDCYQGNPLVNAMSVGIVEKGKTASAIARGEGNPVLIVGSATGRDGIHGATFASEEISEESDAKRPSVQVGDPFTEKLLLEATLEAIATGNVIGIQDMGAAGISCSTSEMSAKGSVGMKIDLDKVPARESHMTAYELMLSESQERMLIVAEKGREDSIIQIFDKWDLHAVIIGEVTNTGRIEIYRDGTKKADIPAHSLVLGGGAPVYVRERKRPEWLDTIQKADLSGYKLNDFSKEALQLLESPNLASRKWIFDQYDSMVRTNTMTEIGTTDASVIRIKGTRKALSVKTDCNGRYVFLNPRKGGQIAVAEAARNVVCTGARPLAITNCLNFGNPYKPEVYYQFSEALAGMGEACRVFDTPVTGGNVSFYNESPEAAVYPTPTIGMLGLIENVEATPPMTLALKKEGNVLFQVGRPQASITGSEYLKVVHRVVAGDAPHINLQEEKKLHETLLEAIAAGLIQSAHDVSDGGLFMCLADMFINRQTGSLGLESQQGTMEPATFWFSEDQGRVVIEVTPAQADSVRSFFIEHNVPCMEIGKVTGNGMWRAGETEFSWEEIADPYYNRIRNLYNR
ncbi:MAG: phosphoribosylformylglycinamidine synthase subunit PurL [Bacteroidetes bacterium]|nr:phosphoribosylformylglycinamidine synthase subunit PurL [Bacteroidota bacterium]